MNAGKHRTVNALGHYLVNARHVLSLMTVFFLAMTALSGWVLHDSLVALVFLALTVVSAFATYRFHRFVLGGSRS